MSEISTHSHYPFILSFTQLLTVGTSPSFYTVSVCVCVSCACVCVCVCVVCTHRGHLALLLHLVRVRRVPVAHDRVNLPRTRRAHLCERESARARGREPLITMGSIFHELGGLTSCLTTLTMCSIVVGTCARARACACACVCVCVCGCVRVCVCSPRV